MDWNWTAIRDAVGYIRNFFSFPEYTTLRNRKRRMIDSDDSWSNKRHKLTRLHPTDVILLDDDDYRSPVLSTKRSSVFKTPASRDIETITLDDEDDIITIKRGNEMRFQRIPNRRTQFTSTPQNGTQKPYLNGTNGDTVSVKDTKFGKRSDNKFDMSYFKPFTGSTYLKSLQNGSSVRESPQEPISVTKRRSTRPLDSANYSIRLDDKLQYQKLLEKASSNNSSIYSTPVGSIFQHGKLNSSSRGRRMVDMATKPSNHTGLSVKKTIEKVLNNFESDPVVIKDSDSDSDVIFLNPPSPKPDIKVDPVNSLKKIVDTSVETKPDWINDKVETFKKFIKKRQEEIDALQTVSGQHGKINEEMRLERLTDRVNKALQLKEEILPEKEIEEEFEFTDLSKAHLKLVEKAFRGDSSEVLARKFNLNITRRDLQTLAGLNWLNDEVINFYMNMIIERSKNGKWPKSYAFNTFFYAKLTKDGPQSLRRWTKRIDLFEHDLICVPIHLGMHWCMAIIDFREKSIKYYDSMGGNNNRCLQALRDYLESEHLDKKKTPYDTSDFILENVKDIPQQMNGSDCGMFSCTFAEFITRNSKINFSQEHMPYLRKKMVVEILQGELIIQ